MALILTDILAPDALAVLQSALAGAAWQNGRESAGAQSAAVKANGQLAGDDPMAREWSGAITIALSRHQGFHTAALPRRITTPLFSRYGVGEHYGAHIDNAIRAEGRERMRTDLAATLFLSPPDDYDGGDLAVETSFGRPRFKLPAGQMLLYPASSRHEVLPVTRGTRLAAVLWVQSLVRDDADRMLLLDLDRSVQALAADRGPNDPHILALTSTYHNLLRRWVES
ncbi:PKHD-type hydroxylase [Polymorphobacter multimanifer]|uniref:PKHD-type hydroxylase n=2 Tax=Polymorphobacter multimanifer TaxID=1070431 RepID=A0A841L924_9SPHN|nr:Fe2+-dependent dioxygenase [Polymorphobacter multimanifer]MBB6228920.1 PKHD-type hydroxylase [Polymorphobacter multimanifer]